MSDQESDAGFVERIDQEVKESPCSESGMLPDEEIDRLISIARRAVEQRTCEVTNERAKFYRDILTVSHVRLLTDEMAHEIARLLEAAFREMRGGEARGPAMEDLDDINFSLTAEGAHAALKPTPAPSCPSMPEQRVSDGQVKYWCVGSMWPWHVESMARDLRDLRAWAASQKETRRQGPLTSDETREATNVARKMLALGINIQALGGVTNQTVAGALRATIAHIDELEADLKGAIAVGQYAVKDTRRQALEEAARVCEAIAAADEASRMHAVRVRDANAQYLLWAVQARQNDAEAIRALIDKPAQEPKR